MKKVMALGLIVIVLNLALTGCSLFNKEETPNEDDPTTDLTDQPDETNPDADNASPSLLAPYVLVDFDDTYEDPFPLREINYSGDSKLKIVDASIEGSDDLALFVMNLKDAVSRKDDKKLLSMISEDIKYTFGIGNGKNDFILEWGLSSSPEQSDLWVELERILPYGGKLIYDDMYQIPYMYDSLNLDSPSGVAIGDSINMRTEPSINGDAVDQLNFDYVDVLEHTDKYYTIDGQDFPWIKVKKQDNKEGYVVSKFIYTVYDYRLLITKEHGYWEISTLIAGD